MLVSLSARADAASVEEMGEEEFGGGLDSDSFMARLEADEAAIQEANKLMLVSSYAYVHVYRVQVMGLTPT